MTALEPGTIVQGTATGRIGEITAYYGDGSYGVAWRGEDERVENEADIKPA